MYKILMIQEERNEGYKNRSKEGKWLLFAGNMIIYTENPQASMEHILELISEVRKIVGHRTNAQKPVLFLNTRCGNQKIKFTERLSIQKY